MRLQLFVHGRSAACKKTDFSLQFQDASIDWALLVASIKRQLIQNLRLQKDDFLAFQYVDDEGDTVTVRNPQRAQLENGRRDAQYLDQQRFGMERSVASERRRADGLSRYALGSSLQGANMTYTMFYRGYILFSGSYGIDRQASEEVSCAAAKKLNRVVLGPLAVQALGLCQVARIFRGLCKRTLFSTIKSLPVKCKRSSQLVTCFIMSIEVSIQRPINTSIRATL